MTNELQTLPSAETISRVILGGDLSKLTDDQRIHYYNAVCASLGLNPLTKPFQFIPLNGKLVMYAAKDCTEQLRRVYNVSLSITARETIGDVHIITARATMPGGRFDESTGAVSVAGLKGESLSNAFMKCETKAKRRVTLSICGLGILDESEADDMATVPGAVPKPTTGVTRPALPATVTSGQIKAMQKQLEFALEAGYMSDDEVQGFANKTHQTDDEIRSAMDQIADLIRQRRAEVVEPDQDINELIKEMEAILLHENFKGLPTAWQKRFRGMYDKVCSGETVTNLADAIESVRAKMMQDIKEVV